MSKILKNILLIVLVLAVVSNAYVHIDEIKETHLNTIQTQINSEVIAISNNLIASTFEAQLDIIKCLHRRILALEKRKSLVMNKIERQVPDFEKLMNGTVVIYNDKHMVGGVCIDEDETYYYILTVEHLLWGEKEYSRFPKNAVPESSMGLATNLGTIISFIKNDKLKEPVPKKEIINTTVQNRNYTSVAGEFIYVNSMLDLGFLRVYKSSGMKLEIIKIADITPEIGDEIYILGHPLGARYNLSKGIVSNLDRPFFMGVDAVMTFGNSGGGVFNSNGELVGICSRVPVYRIEAGEKSTITIPDKIR